MDDPQTPADHGGQADTQVTEETLYHLEKLMPDGSWVACTSERSDPRDLLDVLAFRERRYADEEHHIVSIHTARTRMLVDADELRRAVGWVPWDQRAQNAIDR